MDELLSSKTNDFTRMAGGRRGDMKNKREMEWILCSEKLPEEREWLGTKRFGTKKSAPVLVTMELKDGNKIVIYTSFENGEITDSIAKYYGKKPLAWMPLPTPYPGKTQ